MTLHHFKTLVQDFPILMVLFVTWMQKAQLLYINQCGLVRWPYLFVVVNDSRVPLFQSQSEKTK